MLNDNLQPCGDARYGSENLETTVINQDLEQVKQSYGLNWKKPSEKPVITKREEKKRKEEE